MRIWFKQWKDSHLVRDYVVHNDSDDTRTHKIFGALTEVCREFDLSQPMWLDNIVKEFKKHSKARFYQDAFIDEIDFDYLEIQVLEED